MLKLFDMKKLYTFLVIAIVFVGNAQIVTIPDANFKAKLLAADVTNTVAYNSSNVAMKIDSNNDGNIQVSEALAVYKLYARIANISDLTGIASFTNLTVLSCRDNQLTNVNISNLVNLEEFYCYNNQLTSLDISNSPNLRTLQCYGNSISNLNISNCFALTEFYCYNNLLTTLDVSNRVNLTKLYCQNNLLTTINTSNCTNLNDYNCSNNSLTSIDVSSNLTGINATFKATNNLLTVVNLPVFNNAWNVDLSNNLFQTLEFTSGKINVLFCDNMPNLEYLFIKNIILSFVGPDGFSINNCPNIKYICTSDNRVQEMQTYVDSLNYSCTVNSYCSFVPAGVYYTIQGYAKYDLDNNGCNISDISIPYLKTSITNGTYSGSFFSNSTGNYSLPVSAGTIILNPLLENPTYFNISPTTTSINFPGISSPYIQNFCITKNGTNNDLEVTLIPLSAAIPSTTFNSLYKIIYRNKGTATQNGTVNLTFDDTKMDLVSALPTNTSSATNSLSWSFSNLQPFETREILLTMNINSPTETPAVNGGDILSFTATIVGATDETQIDNTFTLNQTVVNSFDPNDKTCLEGTTVSPSTVGQYVHYVIRFENTGTANAQNIVVKDMIDTAKYDVSSLLPLSGSAPFTTRIINTNQVEFIFQNINLPFNDGNNDGYVAFKIKTKPTLVVGNTFSNNANIYFDYNFPITTNTYTTTITALGTQDFEFGSVFSLSPVPTKNVLTITTKQDVVMSSASIYNILFSSINHIFYHNVLRICRSCIFKTNYIMYILPNCTW